MTRSILFRGALVANLLCAGGIAPAFAEEETPFLSDCLAAWYRADTGVETNEAGKVTAWRNLGNLGAELDTTTAVEDGEGGLVVYPAGCAGRPCVGFDGNQYLRTAAGTTLGITSSGCAWFIVFYPEEVEDSSARLNQAIFGSGGSTRFGVFFSAGTGYVDGSALAGFFYNLSALSVELDGPYTQLHTGTSWTEPSGTYGYAMHSAYYSDLRAFTISPEANVFHIGHMGIDWMHPFKGGIAELRIYNRPLTASERSRIQFELSSYYGLRWDGHGQPDRDALGWYRNAAFQGPLFDCGAAEEKSLVCSNDWLTVTLSYPTEEGANSEVCSYLTHDGVDSISRTWYFSSHHVTGEYPVTFAFDCSNFEVTSIALYYRRTLSEEWRRLPYEPVCDGHIVRFDMPALEYGNNGYFRIGPREGMNLAAWFRADDGVETNELGQVSVWKNRGSLGSILDAYPTNSAVVSHITLVPDSINGRSAASFDGEACLCSTNSSNLEFVNGAGGAWFVVFKPADGVDVLDRRNRGLFGMSESDGARSGAFAPWTGASDDGMNMVHYLYAYASYNVKVPLNDGWQIAEHFKWNNGGGYSGRSFMDGVNQGAVSYGWYHAWTAPFYLGDIGLGWSKAWNGEIAELRVYNRQLSNADRALVEISLGAKYGISVTAAGINGVPDGAYLGDAAVMGFSLDDIGDHNVVASTTSAQLTLAFAGEPTTEVSSLTFVGHDGGNWSAGEKTAASAARVWFVSTECPEAGFTVSFDHSVRPDYEYCLQYRSSPNQNWKTVAKMRGSAGPNPVFQVSGLQKGYYALGIRPASTIMFIK